MFSKAFQQPILNLSSELKAEIFASCVDQDSSKFERIKEQQSGFNRVLQAAQNQEKISVELICDFHRLFSQTPIENSFLTPEMMDNNYPGKFRSVMVGTTDFLSEDGIKEILSIMKEEKAAGFQRKYGTLLVPLVNGRSDCNKAIHQGNLPSTQVAIDSLAKELYQKSGKYVILFPRTNNRNIHAGSVLSEEDVSSYMKSAMHSLVNNFNKDMAKTFDHDKKLERIIALIQSCLRLQPFRDCNHRTFALGLLNFLLISNGLGYCPLEDRKIFVGKGLQEIFKIIKHQMKLIHSFSAVTMDITPTQVVVSSTVNTTGNRKKTVEGSDPLSLPPLKRRNTNAPHLFSSSTPPPPKDNESMLVRAEYLLSDDISSETPLVIPPATKDLQPLKNLETNFQEARGQFDALLADFDINQRRIVKKASWNPRYKKLAKEADDLSLILHEQKKFFARPSLANSKSFNEFKSTCEQALIKFETEAQYQRGWHSFHPIVKGIAGVIAVATVLPWLAACASKRGYVNTFWRTPETLTSGNASSFKQGLGRCCEKIFSQRNS